MFRPSALLALLVLAISTTAAPAPAAESKISLPFALQLNLAGKTLPDLDRERVASFLARKNSKRAPSVNAVNTGVTYTAQVGIGSPSTDYTLLIDTGSSNTWVGAAQPYVKTSTSKETPNNVSVTYGSGSFSGQEFIDRLSLSGELVIGQQSIGVASESDGFSGVDGILGVGPTELTLGTLSPDGRATIPTVTDNLFAQGTISSNSIAISFEPITTIPTTNGELTFGGVNPEKFIGSIHYVPITQTSPSSDFWGIDQDVLYGGNVIMGQTAGIVDTGTTLVLLATDVFETYQKATGAVMDDETGLLKLPNAQFNKLDNLTFRIQNKLFVMTPNAQIWPRSLNEAIGGNNENIYLVVADLGTPTGQGLDFVNGYTFLERYYSVYDTEHRQVGLALTSHTFDNTN